MYKLKPIMQKKKMNKKADIPSIIFAIVAIFIIGIFLFFMNHLIKPFYDKMDNFLAESERYNTTEIREPLQKIQSLEGSRMWDYVFLAIAFGYFAALALVGYSTRISPLFFWFYAIVAVVGLILAVMLANTWQEMTSNPEFADTITRFPITNTLLGSYFPIFITIVIVIVMILLFGKFSGGAE